MAIPIKKSISTQARLCSRVMPAAFIPFVVPARGRVVCLLFLCIGMLLLTHPSHALDPAEVAVVANAKVAGGVRLARRYMTLRNIPDKNLCVLHTAATETISRSTYNNTIRKPVLAFLKKRRQKKQRPRIHCLVTMFGMPLKIAAADKEDKGSHTTRAAVDSELALVLSGSYPLAGWLPNPYYPAFRHQNGKKTLQRDNVLMVSRIDGPDLATARRLIQDSLTTEKTGLTGRACFDARWPEPEKKKLSGYALYDASLHKAAQHIKSSGRMQVCLDQRQALFARGDCPDTALYCGWYSLSNYVDAFTWAQGAIGYHIASGECATLKDPKNNGWCRQILAHGAAATIGPVYEPYVQGFPLPELFFSQLIEGYLSLGETFLTSLPYLSWQVILIGDPLYQPFTPIEKTEKIP